MNITRRSILKALGIGSAVVVSGVSVADKRIVAGVEHWDIRSDWAKPTEDEWINVWDQNVVYERGDTIQTSDGVEYISLAANNINEADGHLYKAMGTS